MSKLSVMPGIESVTPITRPFKLASRESHPDDTVIEVLGTRVGNGTLTIMAGPCSVEGREMMLETARAVAKAGATILRGGAFKPRTSPYASRAWASRGSSYLAEASKADRPADHHRGDGAGPGRSRRQSTPTSSRSAPATCRTTRS